MSRILVLATVLGLAVADVSPENREEALPLSERQYLKALELRSSQQASAKQLKQAASLLKAAGGVQWVEEGGQAADNALIPKQAMISIHPSLHVAAKSHTGALKELSSIYLHGDQGLPANPGAAHALMSHAASLGDPEAQRQQGIFLAAGIHPPALNATHKLAFELGERDWEGGLANLFWAASNNDSVAQMALGYRHMHGLGVERSCNTAMLYYHQAAEKVVELARHPNHLPRVEGNALLSEWREKAGMPSREQEMLHYQWFADMGYVDAQRIVGKLLSKAGSHNSDQALRYFRQAAEAGDPDAQAQLGHMYAAGNGVPASNATALKYFRAASAQGSPGANYGLGFMYLHGYGLPQDYRSALKYLNLAADQAHGEAWFHLGTMYLNGWGVPPNVNKAHNLFAYAAQVGHVLAQYNLALLLLETKGNCELAIDRMKSVAERGPWSSVLQDSLQQYARGRHDLALLGYLVASELGYETAQVNVAWLLSHNQGIPAGHSAISYVQPGGRPSPAASTKVRAHQRASQQGNVASMLAIGDAYYYGRGLPRDWAMAFRVYTSASRFRNAQAHFNLGFMHEFGAGVTADFALAKRNYDKAMELMPSAFAPVQAALFSLSMHARWNSVREYLPAGVRRLGDALYTLHEPTDLSHPAGSYLPKFALGGFQLDNLPLQQIFSASFWDPEGVWISDGDLWETCLLIALLGCLWMIVWRRMSIRAARRRRAAAQDGPPDPDGLPGGRSPRGYQPPQPAAPPAEQAGAQPAGAEPAVAEQEAGGLAAQEEQPAAGAGPRDEGCSLGEREGTLGGERAWVGSSRPPSGSKVWNQRLVAQQIGRGLCAAEQNGVFNNNIGQIAVS